MVLIIILNNRLTLRIIITAQPHRQGVRNSQPTQLLQCMNGFSGHEWVFCGAMNGVFAESVSPRLA